MSKEDLKFEDGLNQLEEIVKEMESGELSLDALLERFEKGIGLLRLCEDKLAKAEARIEVLTRAQIEAAEEHAPTTEPQTIDEDIDEDEVPWHDELPSDEDVPPPPEAPEEESLF